MVSERLLLGVDSTSDQNERKESLAQYTYLHMSLILKACNVFDLTQIPHAIKSC